MISSSQRPLPDNTQHSQKTNINVPGGIGTHEYCKITSTKIIYGLYNSVPAGIFVFFFQDGGPGDTEERATVRMLREMAGKEMHLPDDLVPPEYRAAVTSWLVRRATCPIRYVWDDLGPYFWPRWVRRGECLQETGQCTMRHTC